MKRLCLGVLALAATTGVAWTEPVKLTFASPAPAPTPVHAAVLEGWAKKVTEDSNGTLQVELVTGGTLAAHGQVLDRVAMGVVQIGWDIQGYYPGKFPKTEVVALPFGFETAEAGTMALNKLLGDGLIADEYGDVKVLNLFTFPNGYMLSTKPIETIGDMQGLKASAINPSRQAMISALDGVPVSLSIVDWYQGLSRGVIDAALESYSAVPPFRLAEVTSHFVEVPMGGNAAMMFMNKDVYDSLPPEAKKAIDDNTGPEFDRRMGAFWDGAAAVGRGMIVKAGGTIVKPADADAWEAALQPVIDAWTAGTANGPSILAAFRTAAQAPR